MKIAFNTLSENPFSPSGSLDWYKQMINGFGEHEGQNEYYVLVSKSNKHFFKTKYRNIILVNAGYSNEKRLFRILSEQMIVPFILWRKKMDIFFTSSGGGVAPIFLPRKTKLIISLYGTQHLKPNLELGLLRSLYRKFFGRSSLRKANKIIVNSNSCKADIESQIKYNSKIEIIYHGIDLKIFNSNSLSEEEIRFWEKYRITKPYLLFVSTIWYYKNVHTMLKAFGLLLNKHKLDIELVLIGRIDLNIKNIKNYINNLNEIIDKYNINKNVRFIGRIENKDIKPFYTNAECYIQPSYYETFGKTVIEAFACGCPVIASNTGSTPEIVGNAGILFNPYNYIELTNAMHRVIFDKKYKGSLINSGKERASLFTLEKEVKNFLNVFNSLRTEPY